MARRNVKAMLAEQKAKGRAALRRARAAYEDQSNRNAAATVIGGAAAGAVRGAGYEVDLGPDMSIGFGAPIGLGLLLFGAKVHPQAKAAGAGMLAGEAYAYADDYVSAAMLADTTPETPIQAEEPA